MTICIAVKVNECLVFAADSATSIDAIERKDANGDPVQQVYRHGHKVFQLHKTLPLMGMTCGVAFIGNKSISMLSKEFRQKISPKGDSELKDGYTMKDVAQLAHEFYFVSSVKEAFDDPKQFSGVFEFYIGGYSDGSSFPELWKIQSVDGVIGTPKLIAGENDCAVIPAGQPDPVSRLLNGFGWGLENILIENDVTPESHPQLYKSIPQKLFLPLVHHIMPVKDAIDLAEFLADMTRKVFRFRAVQEYVSGEIDIAVVTRYENFKWIKRKHFYKHDLNRETNHG